MEPNKIFTIRIYKNRAGKGLGIEWSNEYNISVPGAETVDGDLAERIANDLLKMEQEMAIQDVFFNRAVISDIREGNVDGADAVYTIDSNLQGIHNIPVGESSLPLEAVVKMKLTANGGRGGSKEFRGLLHTGHIGSESGQTVVIEAKRNDLNNIALNYMQNAPALNQYLVVVTDKGDTLVGRPVTRMSFAGLKFQKRTVNRRPKVSTDVDAIKARLLALIKELAFVSASLAAARALGNLPTNAPVENELASVRLEAQNL